MTETLERRRARRRSNTATRAGYVVAIIVNIVVLVVANNLLEWEWPSFLTDEFSEVLPLLNLSVGATLGANVVYLGFDAGWFKAVSQIALNVISLVVTARFLQVFPFDFSEWDTSWSWLVRMVLVVAIVGVAIGTIAELVKLMRIAAPSGPAER